MSRLTRFLSSVYTHRMDGRLLPLQQPGFPVAVCWSAKSGCTTVLKWFLAQNGLLDEALAYNEWIHAYRQDKLFAAKGYAVQCARLFRHTQRNTLIIRVIRDPASRAVSSFLHLLRNEHDLERWPDATELTRWKVAVGLAGQQGLSFRQFLLYVAAQQVNRRSIDPHFRPQYDEQQDARVDTYVRLEDLSAGLRAVEDHCRLPHVDVKNLSSSPHHNPATANHGWPTRASEFPADLNILRELGTPPVRAFLDAETRLLIQTVYWKDYEAYGHHYDATPAATLRMPSADVEKSSRIIQADCSGLPEAWWLHRVGQ
jgi:hypothetical protein